MKNIKLVLVDDEEDFIKTFAERLRIRDINSKVATSGEEALELLKKELPDVVLSDLKMPGIDGLDLLREIKRHYPEIQVIILTGHGSDKEEKESFRLGAFDYLRKPVEINKFVQIMEKAYEEKLTYSMAQSDLS